MKRNRGLKRVGMALFQKLCSANIALGAKTIYGAMLGAVCEMVVVVVLAAALLVWCRS